MERIDMVIITPNYMPKVSGKYLVRTESVPHKNINYFQARVSRITKDGKDSYSIDVSNQTVTHISTKPLE
jgi:hypothetical protein